MNGAAAAYWLERAWVNGAVRAGVGVRIADGRFTEVTPDVDPGAGQRLAGLTIPGIANCHSHAFHRALRGYTQRGPGTFWSWREQMYDLAARLDPDSYYALARACYAEMIAAGYTCVGEFHYLHHGRRGRPYADPNAIGAALIAAARDAGIRIALLDTCYLAAGIGRAIDDDGVQARFSDGDAGAWADRAGRLAAAHRDGGDDGVWVGAAIHSVRAVPRDQLPVVAGWARQAEAPLHVHLSEQVAENEQCQRAYGRTPTAVLAEAGALSRQTTVVHATHLTTGDIKTLGAAGCYGCLCPTTERDLGDGIGPSIALRNAGVRLTVGSDSHAVVDAFEELRAVELDERLASGQRGRWSAAELLAVGMVIGHASLGFPDAGRLVVGARADLVTVDTGSPRTAGTGASAESVVFAAGAGDISQVIIDGRVVFSRGDEQQIGAALDRAISAVRD